MAAVPQITAQKSETETTAIEDPSLQPEPMVDPIKTEAEPAVVEPVIDPAEVAQKSETETAGGGDPSVQPEPSVDPTKTEAEPTVVEPEIDPSEVVSATPVAMYKPGDAKITPLPGTHRRRSLEEMSKRPEWLPDDWKMETRKRNSGRSAGEFDQYFFSPTGKRLRSKNEVKRFLATEAASDATTGSASGSGEKQPTESPAESGNKKQKIETRKRTLKSHKL